MPEPMPPGGLPDPPAAPTEPDEEVVLRALYGPPDENGVYTAPGDDATDPESEDR